MNQHIAATYAITPTGDTSGRVPTLPEMLCERISSRPMTSPPISVRRAPALRRANDQEDCSTSRPATFNHACTSTVHRSSRTRSRHRDVARRAAERVGLHRAAVVCGHARTWGRRSRDPARRIPTACVEDAPFAYVSAFRDHVNVGFFHGTALPDPAGLLQGTGKYMRHVKVKPMLPSTRRRSRRWSPPPTETSSHG
jgi:hypothetical protein